MILFLPFRDSQFTAAVCAWCAQLCPTLRPQGLQPARLLWPWNSPGKNTGVHCHFLLQNLPDPGIDPPSLASPALAGGFFNYSHNLGSLCSLNSVKLIESPKGHWKLLIHASETREARSPGQGMKPWRGRTTPLITWGYLLGREGSGE